MFFTLIIQPITNILVAVFQVVSGLGIPFALGFSIILLTIIIRLILYPLIAQQMRASKKMQEMQPHVAKLKEKHKNDVQRLQQETMLLYKEYGVNPVAGCLPVIIQLPVIWGLYAVLNDTVKQTSYQAINKMLYSESLHLDKLWDTQFFGLPLGQNPSELLSKVGPIIFLVPILTGVFQYIQSKQMMPAKKTDPQPKKKPEEMDFATAFQTQSMYIFPIMIGFFSYTFPIGLSLYWNTFTIFGIIQQYLMQKEKAAVTVPAPVRPEFKAKRKKK